MDWIECRYCHHRRNLDDDFYRMLSKKWKAAVSRRFIAENLDKLRCRECGAHAGFRLSWRPARRAKRIGQSRSKSTNPNWPKTPQGWREAREAADYSKASNDPDFIRAQKKRLKDLSEG